MSDISVAQLSIVNVYSIYFVSLGQTYFQHLDQNLAQQDFVLQRKSPMLLNRLLVQVSCFYKYAFLRIWLICNIKSDRKCILDLGFVLTNLPLTVTD